MKKAIIGKKIGMTQIFDESGKVIPVTVVEAGPCVVSQKKTVETDGYDALQIGFGDLRPKLVNKPMKGHFDKSDVAPKRVLKECRFEDVNAYNVGDIIKADVFEAGDHQSTFGGNPLACAAGRVVLRELTRPGFFERVSAAGLHIRNTISSWGLPCVKSIRGSGLMIGVDITPAAADVQKRCLEEGLCISTAGVNTLRFLPPLVITDEEINTGLGALKKVLAGF